jgi:hypothetical protein
MSWCRAILFPSILLWILRFIHRLDDIAIYVTFESGLRKTPRRIRVYVLHIAKFV